MHLVLKCKIKKYKESFNSRAIIMPFIVMSFKTLDGLVRSYVSAKEIKMGEDFQRFCEYRYPAAAEKFSTLNNANSPDKF